MIPVNETIRQGNDKNARTGKEDTDDLVGVIPRQLQVEDRWY